MIYVIDHKDSFTHNVVHQFSLFDKVECDDFSKINKKKLNNASTIVFSPGPGSPKDYPLSSKIYKQFKGKKKIIGITCHNSIHLAKLAIKDKADYIAFGAFFATKTKKVKFKANLNLLKKITKITKTPIVAIGGINSANYKKLLLNKANFLAISGYIWSNKKLKPTEAIKELK